MTFVVLVIVLVSLAVVGRAGWSWWYSEERGSRSVDRYGNAMQVLRALPERVSSDPYPAKRGAPLDSARRRPGEPAKFLDKALPLGPTAHEHQSVAIDNGRAARVVARVIGLDDPPGGRDPVVEANARVTGTTGLVLIVLLFLEGLTIPFIRQLVSWHILIGLVLLPPLFVKMSSVLWRFGRYYLHDPRYRQAGPPHPLLRALGPLVVISTFVLFCSGIVLWLAGPRDHFMFRLHQVSFVAWFIVVAVHVAAHLLRATRLAAADSQAAQGGRARQRQAARARRRLVGASLLLGLVVGLAGHSITSTWTARHPSAPAARVKSPGPSRLG